jgi:hypothetical protein
VHDNEARSAAASMAQLHEQVEFPGETFILNIEGDHRLLKRKFLATPGTTMLSY